MFSFSEKKQNARYNKNR